MKKIALLGVTRKEDEGEEKQQLVVGQGSSNDWKRKLKEIIKLLHVKRNTSKYNTPIKSKK